MNHIFKSILATIMLTMVLVPAFSKETFELTIGSDGKLTLKDGGNATLGSVFNRKVSWEIMDDRIESFRIELKGTNDYDPDPFNERYSKRHDKKLELQVRFGARNRNGGFSGDWGYTIFWTDRVTHREYSLDPIITIKPTATFTLFIILIPISILAGILIGIPMGIRQEKKRSIRKISST